MFDFPTCVKNNYRAYLNDNGKVKPVVVDLFITEYGNYKWYAIKLSQWDVDIVPEFKLSNTKES